MPKIGFKTARMERDERMPVPYVEPESKESAELTAATADYFIRLRLKQKAIGFVERYMSQPFDCFDAFAQELKDLRRLYMNTRK